MALFWELLRALLGFAFYLHSFLHKTKKNSVLFFMKMKIISTPSLKKMSEYQWDFIEMQWSLNLNNDLGFKFIDDNTIILNLCSRVLLL